MPSLRYALACHLCAVITCQIHDLLKLRSLNRRLAQTLMPAIRQDLSQCAHFLLRRHLNRVVTRFLRLRIKRNIDTIAKRPVEEKLAELLERRLAGEPVAYLIGEWEFYGLGLDITPDVLIPRMDTEVLAERAILLARAAGEGARVLDLCAGSGCVGLAVAANVPGCRVVLADVSEAALRLCKQNVRRNELNARVTCVQADALEPPDAALWDFDVIACNPPYIPTGDIAGLDVSVRDYEPRSTLDGGADGLDFYRAIAARWGAALRLGGALLFEVGIGQAGDVGAILAQNQFEQIQTFQDTQGIGRVVEGVLNS